MAVRSTPPVCFSDIIAEFGDDGTPCISEYYAGGGIVNQWSPEVPSSAPLCWSDFLGSTNTPSYTMTRSRASITEGGASVTFTLRGRNVAPGTNVPYTITGVTSGDVSVPLTGNFTIGSAPNYQATLTFTALQDGVAEGTDETATVTAGGVSQSVLIVLPRPQITQFTMPGFVQLPEPTEECADIPIDFTDPSAGTTEICWTNDCANVTATFGIDDLGEGNVTMSLTNPAGTVIWNGSGGTGTYTANFNVNDADSQSGIYTFSATNSNGTNTSSRWMTVNAA